MIFLSSIWNVFGKATKDLDLKIGTFGIMNNPEYRQEAWRESIAQRLAVFDVVCLVCGREEDLTMLADAFPKQWASGALKAVYKYWPFPEWSYEELPRHLNAALALAHEQKCHWMVKFDLDTVLHERDADRLRKEAARASQKGKWIISIPKLQFFTPTRYWCKGSLPIMINMDAPIAYGFDRTQYTDLCQPIVWDGHSTVVYNAVQYDIPSGDPVPADKIYRVRGITLFNYDFTFRTYERSIELLYQIEMAHARFWGKGYSGISIEHVSRETAMQDFLDLSKQRLTHMTKSMSIQNHPHNFQQTLRGLTPDQWGHHLWGKM